MWEIVGDAMGLLVSARIISAVLLTMPGFFVAVAVMAAFDLARADA